MGWQDDPIAKPGVPDVRPKWMSDPIAPPKVETKAPAAESSNPFVREGQSELSNVGDASDAAITSLLNLPHNVWQSLKDLVSSATGQGVVEKTPGPAKLESSTVADLQPGAMGKAAIAGAKTADTALENASPTAHDILHHVARVGGDVLDVTAAGGAAKTAFEGGSALLNAARAAPKDAIDQALSDIGYKNLPRQSGASAPAKVGANVVGEASLTGPQTLNNQAVTDVLARHEAGVPQDKKLGYDTIGEARQNGPGKVYDAAHDALPESVAQDPTLRNDITAIGDTTSQLPRSPDVDALKEAMLQQPNMTRDELFANIEQARDRASRLFASDKPDDQAMGDAYHALSNAYENFVGRQLGANPQSPVSLADWQNARTAFAKNYAVQGALQGTSVDASKLAAIQRKDPGRLTGGLQLIAEQHNRYPLSTGFGPRTLAQPGVGSSGSLEGNIARHITGPTAGAAIGFGLGGHVGAAVGSGTGLVASNAFQSIIRRALSGSPARGARMAGEAITDPKLGSFFDQLTGGDAGPRHETLPPFPPPQGELSLADELGAGGPHEDPGEGIPLADVLSHGVEKPAAPGLSTAPMGAPPSNGIPFTRNAGHEAGGLDLMDLLERGGAENNSDLAGVQSARIPDRTIGAERTLPRESPTPGSGSVDLPTRPGLSSDELSIQHNPTLMELLENLSDHPAVRSQGVPEDIMTRTANNASSESPASLEAINRTTREQAAGQDRFLIDPDGKMWPIRGVEAADARAPKGSIIVQKGIGGEPYSILDRGGLPRSHANGLLNRALAGGNGLTLMDLLDSGGG